MADIEERGAADRNAQASERAYVETITTLTEILTGDIRRRAFGVGLILAGLAVAALANILSLTM